MQEDPAILSFFIDAKRYIKHVHSNHLYTLQGQPRKLLRHVSFDLESISTAYCKLKYCHYLTHASIRVLLKYSPHKKHYATLIRRVLATLRAWFLILQTEPINKYCILFPPYLIKTALILLKQ